MSERCHYIKSGKDWVFIPACMGSAAGGPAHCTCATTEQRCARLEELFKGVQVRLRALEHAVQCYMPEGTSTLVEMVKDDMKRRDGDDWEMKAKSLGEQSLPFRSVRSPA